MTSETVSNLADIKYLRHNGLAETQVSTGKLYLRVSMADGAEIVLPVEEKDIIGDYLQGVQVTERRSTAPGVYIQVPLSPDSNIIFPVQENILVGELPND